MSIELMSIAWKTTLSTSAKMVLLVMCDRANDAGGSLHPSIKYVAKRSSMSERQVQRTLRDLEDVGLIRVIDNQNGGKPGKTRRYLINVKALRSFATFDQTGDNLSTGDVDDETGDNGDVGRVTSATSTGDVHVTQYTIDPSEDPSKDPASKLASQSPDISSSTGQADEIRKPLKVADLVALGVEAQLVHDWFVIRKDKGSKHFTASDLRALEVNAGRANFTLSEAIQTAVDNGWRGFKSQWVNKLESRSTPLGKRPIHDLSGMVYGKRAGEGDIPS